MQGCFIGIGGNHMTALEPEVILKDMSKIDWQKKYHNQH